MIYKVCHATRYAYPQPVSLCQNIAHLAPRRSPRQTTWSTELEIEPRPAVISRFTDFFGNPALFFAVEETHRGLTATATHTIEVAPLEKLDLDASPPWEKVRDGLCLSLEAFPFVFDSPHAVASALLAEFAAPSFPPGCPVLRGAVDLSRRIHSSFRYDSTATTVATPLEEVMEKRRGVCQDFAHLQIGCLRSLGLAARYVSGYLRTLPPAGQARLVGADASHAWVSVYSPNLGWVDLDPTNNLIPSDQHIVLAWGRDFDDVSPIKGVILGGGEHKVSVSVDVSEA